MNDTSPVEQVGQVDPSANGAATEEDDPFRYGWRYVQRSLPDGSVEVDQVPLSLEDVLYPEEGDYVVNQPPHLRDFFYCHAALETFHVDEAGVVVLGDCRVDWGVEGVRPLGPDILVLFGVREWKQLGTFRVAEEGGRPILVIELTSPSTHVHDVGRKIDLYYQAGVQKYVIVDRGPRNEDPPRLIGYQRGRTGWKLIKPDAQGRISLAPVQLLIGLEDGRPWLYEAASGKRLPDHTQLAQALADAEVKTRDDEAKARKAEAKAREEASARAALEARLRELEEQLRGRPEGSAP